MTEERDTTQIAVPRLCLLALSMGLTAALFTAVVAGALIVVTVRAGAEKPPVDARLEALLDRYHAGETDEEIREKIRAEDVRVRNAILGRQTLYRRGTWLLVAGGVLTLAGLWAYWGLRPSPVAAPDPDPEALEHETRERLIGAAWAAAIGALLLIVLVGLAVWGRSVSPLPTAQERVASDD